MALKEYLLLTTLITTSIGVSTALAWNPNIPRYQSYNLEKGPVFYEAYYPDSNEESGKNYQEKRYFDRGTVLERTYQVPSERFAYPSILNNNLRAGNYPNPVGRLEYPEGYIDPRLALAEKSAQPEHGRSFPPDQDFAARNNVLRFQPEDAILGATHDERLADQPSASLDIKEISSLARRAISRDLENWSALEGYLDRSNYRDQRPSYRRPIADIDFPRNNALDGQVAGESGPALLDSFKEERAARREPYEKVREESTALRQDRIESSNGQRNADVMRRLDARDLASRGAYAAFDPIRHESERLYQREPAKSRFELPADETAVDFGQQDLRKPLEETRIADPYASENIFEPRPQVINYVFSKRLSEPAENKTENATSTKTTAEDRAPRNYGDNLIREEVKKTEEGKDVKVTSIEISEVPRHRTRHHHGEWPRRDYSHRHQS